MIHNFTQVIEGLYRGGAPTPLDIYKLYNDYGINKVISLDYHVGKKIDRACQMLGINHIMIPIDHHHLKKSLIKLFSYDLKDLLLNDGPTFVHCFAGKDRTGFIIALFKCKYMRVSPEEALEEAKTFGYGINADPNMINLFTKIIKSCKPVESRKSKIKEDWSAGDIVSNTRLPISDTRTSPLDEAQQSSFAPYLSTTRQYPYDNVYNPIYDQDIVRNVDVINQHNNGSVPQVGQFNNEVGMQASGPAFPIGGFIYD